MNAEEWKGRRHWSPDRPNNPENAHLGAIGIELETGSGKIEIDQTTAVGGFLELHHGEPLKGAPGDFKARMDELGRFLTKATPVPDAVSIISGEPAIIYRTQEVTLLLTIDEAKRLVLNALSREEFEAIIQNAGAIWELHDDFYDPESGEAFQPRINVPGQTPLEEL
ncbi:hypothetical protein [Roseibium sp. RKSG952]|uniref:hypothetical protein n=1 Tax=Roseibium sp. RKSG952 TaxID=2529384 RepID=UPI0012BC1BAA|nr:hypothetical protein [Roseibium sp. RKSG952]MTH94682.1 hypothetical protein [Roseibium sp. RKSG952]